MATKISSFEIFDLSEDVENKFEHLLSPKALAVMNRVGAYGIGIAVSEDYKLMPAGVLVFFADKFDDTQEDPSIMELSWLYVDEKYRNKGVGTRLLEVFADIVNDSEVDGIICDVPLDSSLDILVGMLQDWDFEFSLIEKNEYLLSWGDIAGNPLFKNAKKSQKVLPLKSISKEALSKILSVFKLAELQDFVRREMDPDLSCAYINGNTPEGIFLIRRNPKNMLEPVILRVREKLKISAEVKKALLCSAAANVPSKEKENLNLYVVLRSLEGAALWDEIFPNIRPELVRRGVCDLQEEEL